jgi:TP901 family phage tail tape measure protein
VSTTDELLLRISVVGASEGAAEIDAVNVSLGETEVAAGKAARGTKGLSSALFSMKALFAGFTISAAVKQFSSFQAQMERLKTQTGSTQAEVGKMSKGILAMAASVGASPNSLAQALYHIQSAGYRGATALKALRIAAEGAAVGGADLTDTTTSMTALMVGGFLKGQHSIKALQTAMGELNATVGAGDMTFQDLNSALSTGALATLATYGLKVKDLGAALAVLGDNNVRGAAAANRLRMGLSAIISPSSTVTKALKELGFGQLQLANDLQKPNGLLVMLEAVKTKYDELIKTQGKAAANAAISKIFGSGKNSAAMFILLRSLDAPDPNVRLQTKYGNIDAAGKSFQKDWEATTKTLAFFIAQVKAFAEVLLIKLGPAIQWVANKIQAFVKALSDGKPWAKAIAALGGFVLAMLAVRKVMGWLGSAVGAALRVMRILADGGVPGLIRSFLGLDAATKTAAGEQGLGGLASGIRGTVLPALKNLAKAAGAAAVAWYMVTQFMKSVNSNQANIDAGGGHHSFLRRTAAWHANQQPGGLPTPGGGALGFLGLGHSDNSGVDSPSQIKSYMVIGGKLVQVPGHAWGGTTGVDGWSVVGERGPEILRLPGGSRVTPHGETPQGLREGESVHLEAEIPVTLVLPNGRVLARENVRQGLMATARKGTGGPTLITEG